MSGLALSRSRSPAHFEFFAGVELFLQRAVDDVKHAARARHADRFTLLESIDRRNAGLGTGQTAQYVDNFPAQLLLPDLPEAAKSRLQSPRSLTFGHAPSDRLQGWVRGYGK